MSDNALEILNLMFPLGIEPDDYNLVLSIVQKTTSLSCPMPETPKPGPAPEPVHTAVTVTGRLPSDPNLQNIRAAEVPALEDRLYTPKEASLLTGKPTWTIYNAIRRGTLQAVVHRMPYEREGQTRVKLQDVASLPKLKRGRKPGSKNKKTVDDFQNVLTGKIAVKPKKRGKK